MIKNYKYLETAIQLRLHKFVLDFFNRIESETGIFDDSFFSPDFLVIANRHPRILKKRCIGIYNVIKTWNQTDRTNLCIRIRESNNIENICKGNYNPLVIDSHAKGIYLQIRNLFLDLYNQVLNGNGFNETYKTTLRTHFDDFSKLNNEITLCPICGIGELKKHTDDIRDQYDHYLPKALYPFSSINFKNLVPICRECNSLDVKGETDIIRVSTNNKLFFVYDVNHKGINVEFRILNDNTNPNNIIWEIIYTNPDGNYDEIESWKTIYKIESRYVGFINARIEKWYSHYWEFMYSGRISRLDEATKKECYQAFLEIDEKKELSFIRKPALEGFLTGSTLSQAAIEAKYYSLP